MKKKSLLIVFCTFITLCALKAQVYHEDDKDGLRKFLRQPSAQPGLLNLELLSLTLSDTLNWYSSEDWIGKLRSDRYNEIKWNAQKPKRLQSFIIEGSYEKKFSGVLDCSGFGALQTLNIRANQITDIDLSGDLLIGEINCSHNPLSGLDCSFVLGLRKLSCEFCQLSTLNLFHNTKLQDLYCSNNELTRLIFPEGASVNSVICNNNQLTDLDYEGLRFVSYLNCSNNQLSVIDPLKLRHINGLNCSFNNLKYLDPSPMQQLNNLSCDYNYLTEIDISTNLKLTSFSCSGNQLTTIDITHNPLIDHFSCGDNLLTEIEIPDLDKIFILDISNNYLRFSTLPQYRSSHHFFAPQRPILAGEIVVHEEIDISSEYNVDGSITSYSWFDENENAVQLQDLGGGKFMAGNEFIGKTLTCKMKNERVWDLILEYIVTITSPHMEKLTDHLSIVETPTPDYYVSSPGETFRVYAQANIDPAEIRIGLFKTTGVFLCDITESRSDNVYTCRIPDHVNTGNYMLQPYTAVADMIRLVERERGSNRIDKLPFSFTNARSFLNNGVTTLSNHLVLNTSEKNLYKAYIDNDFRIVVNAPVTAYTRIGLFDMYGELVEDITQSVTGKIFTCRLSYNVFPDNYMIMAYDETAIGNRLIERYPGTAVIDKLPLAVDYDWGRRGVAPKSSEGQVGSGIFENIQFYPSPVQDMLYIRSSEPIVSICVYDLNGRLVKDAGKVNQVSLADLPSGTYVLKIQTQEREITGKVMKN